jgi:hypothetical protein
MPTQCKPDTQTQARVIQPPAPTQKCDSDQHNTRREANPVGPSHRNSRPRDSSTKPMLPPPQSLLAQPSSLPGPPLPFTPPENQFTSDPHTIDYYNQFHSWCTTPRCPNLQLTGCSVSTQYLVYAHRPLPATSPKDQLTSDLHTIGFLIPPMSIQVHPSQSNPTHLQYLRSSGFLPDHPDEAKSPKIPKREEPLTPHSIHWLKRTSGSQPHLLSTTKTLPHRPMTRPLKIGVHIAFLDPAILRTMYTSSMHPHSTPHWATSERT